MLSHRILIQFLHLRFLSTNTYQKYMPPIILCIPILFPKIVSYLLSTFLKISFSWTLPTRSAIPCLEYTCSERNEIDPWKISCCSSKKQQFDSNKKVEKTKTNKQYREKKSNQLTQNLIFEQQGKCYLSRAIEQPVEIICRKIDSVIN